MDEIIPWAAFIALAILIAALFLFWSSRQEQWRAGVSDWTLLVIIPRFHDGEAMRRHLRAARIRCIVKDARDEQVAVSWSSYPEDPVLGIFVHAKDVVVATQVLKTSRLWPG